MTTQEYAQAIDQAYRQYVTLFDSNAPQDEQYGQFARYSELRARWQAWDELQAVPAYVSQYQCYHAGLAAFFLAVAMLASQEVDPLTLDWEEANEWRELQDAWEQEGTNDAHI